MHGNEKRTWQEQLADARPLVAQDTDPDAGLFVPKEESAPILGASTPEPEFPKVARPNFQKPSTPADTIDVSNGKLTVKTPAGEASILLPKSVEAEFIAKALQYQQALISEKKANVFATYAMAALSGLSALAIGATLVRSSMSRNSVNILGS